MATVYGYARCSTNESKQNIDRQKRDLMGLGVTNASHIYWEYESGAKADRPELTKLLAAVQPGDTIVATEVSRISRSTKQLLDILDIAKERHLQLLLGPMNIDCRHEEPDAMTEAMLTIAGAFAQMEKRMISDRTKSGIENARAKGKTIGRPKLTADAIPAKFYKDYNRMKRGEINKTELARLNNITRQTMYRYIEAIEKGA